MDCIHAAVGVTNDTTIPFWADLSEELQEAVAESTQGLYIDKLPGGIELSEVIDADYMEKVLRSALAARDEAEQIFLSDMLVAISSRYQSAKPTFNGNIGRKSVSATMNVPQKYTGQRYRAIAPISANIEITRIELDVNAAGTFDVIIARCDRKELQTEEVLYTLPVTSGPGTWTVVPLPEGTTSISLPLQKNGVPQEYYIYYDRGTAGVNPKNNEIKCGTCSGTQRTDPLGEFIEYNGFAANDMSKLNNIVTDKYGRGLCVTAIVSCDNEQLLCREYEKKDSVKLVTAHALRYKAGELWIEYIFKSGYVNKANMQNREYLWGKRNHFRTEYEKRITVIANDMTMGETECYTCKEDRMLKGKIYS